MGGGGGKGGGTPAPEIAAPKKGQVSITDKLKKLGALKRQPTTAGMGRLGISTRGDKGGT